MRQSRELQPLMGVEGNLNTFKDTEEAFESDHWQCYQSVNEFKFD